MKIKYRLHANENPYSLPGELKSKIEKRITGFEFNRYPDSDVLSLRRQVANYIQFPHENIMVGNGSDELLLMLMLGFAGPDKKVIIPVPTFTMYGFYARAAGADIEEVELRPDFTLDWDKIIEIALDEKPDGYAGSLDDRDESPDDKEGLIFICSPNNPTGNIPDFAKIEDLLQKTNMIVVVDEAYYEFCGRSLVDLINKYDNLIVTRTLSKAFGLASLRVGYLVANLPLIERLEEVRSPYNADQFSQEVASLVLQNRHLFKEGWEKIREERGVLLKGLKGIKGITPYPSEANFILFKTEVPEKNVYQQLQAKGIEIRYLSGLPVCGDSLRVTVGKPAENEYFLNCLELI